MMVVHLHVMICILGMTMAIHVRGNAGIVTKDVEVTGGNIGNGVGYSQDLQQLTAQRCYNATTGSATGQQSYNQLQEAISSTELEEKLGISASLSGSFEKFSVNAKASYVRSIEDMGYSLSLNYYVLSSINVAVQIAGFGEKALSESGKLFYQDGKNPYFGLVCGDNFISSYQKGALLALGLYMKFKSSTDKTVFEQEAGVSFGSIISATEKVKKVSTKLQLTGSISIQAFQMGGEPNKLSEILNKDSTGHFYALTCSFAEITNCVQAATGLLDYATKNYPTQHSYEKMTGLTPLGVAFSKYQPIEWLNLVTPTSLVTKDVLNHRNELSSKLKEFKYYQQKLYPFLNNGYPVTVDDVFFDSASALLSKVTKNIHLLMQPHRGSADCYYYPNKCKNIAARIFSLLRNITIRDLNFLNNIRYIISVSRGLWYNSGENSQSSWTFKPYKTSDPFVQVNEVYVSDTSFKYGIGPDNEIPTDKERFSGHVKSDPMKYEGWKWVDGESDSYVVATKQESPFFFKHYSKLNGENKKKERKKIKVRLVVTHPQTITL